MFMFTTFLYHNDLPCCGCRCCSYDSTQGFPLCMPPACPRSFAPPLEETPKPLPPHHPHLLPQQTPAHHHQQHLISHPAPHPQPHTTVIRQTKTAAMATPLPPRTPNLLRHPLQRLTLLLLAPRRHRLHAVGRSCHVCQSLMEIQCQLV
jgi:hypothetical protein